MCTPVEDNRIVLCYGLTWLERWPVCGLEGIRGVVGDWPVGSLLGTLPNVARDRLLQRGTLVRYPGPSKILFREGDKSRFVVLIIRGVVKVTASVPDGGPDALLAIRMRGDAVGEFAAIDALPRSATVTTCGAVVAQIIKSGDFVEFIRHDPDISHVVSSAIAAKMRVAIARRVDFSGSNVSTRVARVLLQLVEVYGNTESNQAVLRSLLTQPEIASLAVASQPAVHRVLRDLRERGIVSTGYRSIVVTDLDRLRKMAYGS
jgi:CRP/FNR family transcriptional regulator, cyclic AMP receptor protein